MKWGNLGKKGMGREIGIILDLVISVEHSKYKCLGVVFMNMDPKAEDEFQSLLMKPHPFSSLCRFKCLYL